MTSGSGCSPHTKICAKPSPGTADPRDGARRVEGVALSPGGLGGVGGLFFQKKRLDRVSVLLLLFLFQG